MQLVRQAETLSQQPPSLIAADKMEAIKDALADIGGADDLSDRVERAIMRFDKRLAVWRKHEGARVAERAEKEQLARQRAAEAQAKANDNSDEDPASDDAGSSGDKPVETADQIDGAEAPGDSAETDDSDTSAAKAQAEEAEKRRQEREAKKRERREQALKTLQEMTEELRAGLELDQRKAAEKLLQKADRAFGDSNLSGSDDAIVASYRDARNAMFLKIQELREAAGWEQWANIAQQEALIAQAKAVLEDEDQSNLGKRLKSLQLAWKEVGPAPRKKGQELWETFKAICDQIYAGVKAERARQSEMYATNLVHKTELCERAEALAQSTDWDQTAAEIKALQHDWKAIGPVPRKKSDAIWKRFRGACDQFFERRKPHMEQRMAEFERNLEKKQAMCEEAETLAQSSEWTEAAAKLRQMQRDWRDVGMVPRKDANAINKRFRSACDQFFERKKDFHEQERRAHAQKIEDLRTEIAAIATLADSDDPLADIASTAAPLTEAAADDGPAPEVTVDGSTDDGPAAEATADDATPSTAAVVGEGAGIEQLIARTLAVRATLRGLAPSGKLKKSLYNQANEMFRSMLAWYRAEFEGTELDPSNAEQKKAKLLAKAEELAPPEKAAETPSEEEAHTPEQMAEKLRAALAQNALSSALANSTDGRNLADSVADLQAEWLVIGPVPGIDGDDMESRFKSACERALRSAGVHE